MNTLDDYKFVVETPHGVAEFDDWSAYPVDLATVVMDEIEDMADTDDDITDIVLMGLCPSLTLALVYTPQVHGLLRDEDVDFVIRLERIDGTVFYTRTITGKREGDLGLSIDPSFMKLGGRLDLDNPLTDEDMERVQSQVAPVFPGMKEGDAHNRYAALSDYDRGLLIKAVVLATGAVVQNMEKMD